MANLETPKYFSTISFLALTTFALFIPATCVNIPLDSDPELLKQSALDYLNDNSPTGNTYKNGDLIRAEKLLEAGYKIYRLMLNLEPNCVDDSSCLHEVCALELRQQELGVTDVRPDSIQCMYLYPQSDEAETQQQTTQDGGQSNSTNTLEPDTTETFEKRNRDSSLQLDHEVQTVADGNERPFIAVRATDKNYCAGCPYELSPTLPGLAAYGEQVAQSMDEAGGSDSKHKVIRIVRVTRAVPPGSNVVLYELLLEIGETNCLRIAVSPRSDCKLLQNTPVKLCLVTFEQRPWQKDSQKIVRNNCTDLPESYNALTDPLVGEPVVTGDALYLSETSSGQETQFASPYASSVDDFPSVSQKTSTPDQANTRRPVVEETATKTLVETNNANVNEPQGFQDKYKAFDEFLENIDFYKPAKQSEPSPTDPRTPVQEDIVRQEVVVRSNSNGQQERTDSRDEHNVQRARRSLSDTLGKEKNLVRQLALKVLDEFDQIDADNKKRVLLDIIDSKKQPGDDTVYYITMKAAKSSCFEGTNECADDAPETVKICKAQIQTDRSKSSETAKVYQSQCFDETKSLDARFKRQLVGGWKNLSSDDPEVKDLGRKVLRQYSKSYGGSNEPLLVSIVDPKAQVVSGMKYQMTVRFGESTCSKGQQGDHCLLKSNSPLEEYFVTIWSQPWKDNGNPKISIVSTKDKSLDRVRRSGTIPGGVTPVDKEDTKIQKYAEEGLRKLPETFGLSYEPYLVKIVESTEQVVAGTLNKIRIRVGESTCPRGVKDNCQLKADRPIEEYEVTVWSQPWLDKGHPDIQVNVYSDQKKVSKRSLRGQHYSENMLKIAETLRVERAFEEFIGDHGKVYKSEEEKNYRFKIFQANMKRIEELREKEEGTGVYGATKFADLTPDEFRSRHLGLRPDLRTDNDIPLPKAEIPDIELPESFDWRTRNVVTEVKDQGSCGSCWAFSVTGNIEALNAIKHGELLSLSEQELVDCDKMDSGCNGGLPDVAYRALEQLGGLELEDDYPYDGKDEKCHFNKKKARVQVLSGLNITSDETEMAKWLVQNGPISIGINANAMQFYMGGISHPWKVLCSGDNLDHGVLIVGFGVHTYPLFKRTMPFWIIKNSWGPNWGEQGYYRVYRGDGTCGLNRMATSAVIA
ncbi:uncharacterized protein [Venturia canescens]|uniref:uncharacterized protein isoform X2 n=1 Tax=Venturia canescens TaxID=32260 RepID=UPI001C9BE551|nr:uncharacterized protein LOC122409890 isoform X2 [Venturia canescens]